MLGQVTHFKWKVLGMSRPFSAEETFSANVEEVFTMMCDPDYLDFLIANSGGIDPGLGVDTDDGTIVVTLDRSLPAEVPSFARAMVGDHITVRESRSWQPPADDGSRSGTLRVRFDGAPMEITGDLTLENEDGGSRLSVSGRVKASIPFVGGKLEEFARDQLLRFVAREEELGGQWLER